MRTTGYEEVQRQEYLTWCMLDGCIIRVEEAVCHNMSQYLTRHVPDTVEHEETQRRVFKYLHRNMSWRGLEAARHCGT